MHNAQAGRIGLSAITRDDMTSLEDSQDIDDDMNPSVTGVYFVCVAAVSACYVFPVILCYHSSMTSAAVCALHTVSCTQYRAA